MRSCSARGDPGNPRRPRLDSRDTPPPGGAQTTQPGTRRRRLARAGEPLPARKQSAPLSATWRVRAADGGSAGPRGRAFARSQCAPGPPTPASAAVACAPRLLGSWRAETFRSASAEASVTLLPARLGCLGAAPHRRHSRPTVPAQKRPRLVRPRTTTPSRPALRERGGRCLRAGVCAFRTPAWSTTPPGGERGEAEASEALKHPREPEGRRME